MEDGDAMAQNAWKLQPRDEKGPMSTLSDQDLFLFNEGTHYRLFDKLGAHVTEESEAHVLIEASGATLRLWDTPGFGNVRRLLDRLGRAGGCFTGRPWRWRCCRCCPRPRR